MIFFRKYKKAIAAFTLLSIINQIILPGIALANNGGDLSAEYSNGGGVGNDLVNMYNGAFNYKVDLLTVPGSGVSFPISISYNSADINMQTVPTSVGLGWSLNLPKITRSIKAVPDDFKGDEIVYEYDMKTLVDVQYDNTPEQIYELLGYKVPNEAINVLTGLGSKKDKWQTRVPLKIGFDNNNGLYVTFGAKSPKVKKNLWKENNPYLSGITNVGVVGDVHILYDSRFGLTFTPTISPTFNADKERKDSFFSLQLSGSVRGGFNGYKLAAGKLLDFSFGNSGVPMVNAPITTTTRTFNTKLGFPKVKGFTGFGAFAARSPIGFYKGSSTITKIKDTDKLIKRKSVGIMYDKGYNN